MLACSSCFSPGFTFYMTATCDGVLAKSFLDIAFFFEGLSRLLRERAEAIEGDLDMKLPWLRWEARSLGPGYRTLQSALRGSTRSKFGCRKASACLYLIVSAVPDFPSPLQRFFRRVLSSALVFIPLSSRSY